MTEELKHEIGKYLRYRIGIIAGDLETVEEDQMYFTHEEMKAELDRVSSLYDQVMKIKILIRDPQPDHATEKISVAEITRPTN